MCVRAINIYRFVYFDMILVYLKKIVCVFFLSLYKQSLNIEEKINEKSAIKKVVGGNRKCRQK